jgi:hypothetical protein
LASFNDRTSTTYSYDTRDQLTGAVTTAIAGMAAPVYLPPAESRSIHKFDLDSTLVGAVANRLSVADISLNPDNLSSVGVALRKAARFCGI